MDNEKQIFTNVKVNFGRRDAGTPEVNEGGGREKWVNFGKDNLFPQEVIRILQTADPLHSAIIQKKIDMVASQGWQEVPALQEFIDNEMVQDDLHDVVGDVAFNAVVFGGFYLNIVWDAEGGTIAKIRSIPFEKVRVAKKTTLNDDIDDGFYVSRDWKNFRKSENEPQFVTAFDGRLTPEALEKRKAFPSQIMFVRLNRCGLDTYVLPTYMSLLSILKLSFEMWNYQLKSAQNSYQPNLIVGIPGEPPPPQQRERLANEYKEKQGTDNAGETVLVWGANGQLPTFTPLQPTSSDKKYLELFKQVNEEVMIGNVCNNVVAGVQTEGKLGSSAEVLEQYQVYQVTVIAPLQKKIENTFNKLAELNGLPGEMKLNNYFDYMKQNLSVAQPEMETKYQVITRKVTLEKQEE